MLYFWKPDPFVELGPPQVTPVGAALAAAGVLFNLDQFAARFWKSGAIKATLLSVDGNPTKDAQLELKTWWQKTVSGINNAFSSQVIHAGKVTPVVIGEGLSSLHRCQSYHQAA